MRTTHLATIAALLMLSACVAGPPATSPQDSCGASGFQGLVGQPGQIARMLMLDQPLRVIPQGSAVTMDYSPARINFELDGADRITAVRCG